MGLGACASSSLRPTKVIIIELHGKITMSAKQKQGRKHTPKFLLSFTLKYNKIHLQKESIMDIKIDGNPGTGNTFQEFNIGHVENFNQGSTVFSNHNGDRKKGPSSVADDTRVDLQLRQAEILEYVCRLKPYVAREWKNRYESTWRDILALSEVAAQVYNPGKQHDTTFNRNLVANIIYIMYNDRDGHGVITEGNATHLAEILEGDKDHSVRRQLGQAPEDRTLRDAVNKLLDSEF